MPACRRGLPSPCGGSAVTPRLDPDAVGTVGAAMMDVLCVSRDVLMLGLDIGTCVSSCSFNHILYCPNQSYPLTLERVVNSNSSSGYYMGNGGSGLDLGTLSANPEPESRVREWPIRGGHWDWTNAPPESVVEFRATNYQLLSEVSAPDERCTLSWLTADAVQRV